jgi:hypothetical protein
MHGLNRRKKTQLVGNKTTLTATVEGSSNAPCTLLHAPHLLNLPPVLPAPRLPPPLTQAHMDAACDLFHDKERSQFIIATSSYTTNMQH